MFRTYFLRLIFTVSVMFFVLGTAALPLQWLAILEVGVFFGTLYFLKKYRERTGTEFGQKIQLSRESQVYRILFSFICINIYPRCFVLYPNVCELEQTYFNTSYDFSIISGLIALACLPFFYITAGWILKPRGDAKIDFWSSMSRAEWIFAGVVFFLLLTTLLCTARKSSVFIAPPHSYR